MLIPFEQRMLHDDMGNAPDLMSEEERERIFGDTPDWYRAGGDCVCDGCGKLYYDHGPVLGALWLTRLCDNTFVKL